MEAKDKAGFCVLCRSRCGTINTVRGNALIAVRPDPSHPTGQAMCMKGKAAPELVHSPHRLLYPMRRTRPKGDPNPGWTRVSWEEALTTIAQKLATFRDESGAEAVAFAATTPSGTPISDSIEWIERFVRVFGSPNMCYGTEVCNWHKDVAHEFTFGCGTPVADYANSDLILLWGHNPTNTWLAQAGAIARGRQNGAQLMVIDPRPTALAQQAESWLRVRPGTDGALALAMIRELIAGDRYDAPFIRDWSNAPLLVRSDTGKFLRMRDVNSDPSDHRFVVWNTERAEPWPYDTRYSASAQGSASFDLWGEHTVTAAFGSRVACATVLELLRQHVDGYTCEWASAITGIKPEQIREAAGMLARSKRVAYHAWTGVGQHTNATQTERAIATLYALLGSFDKDGGNRVFGKPPYQTVNDLDILSPEQRGKAIGLVEMPLGPPARGWISAPDTYRAILYGKPYRIRALVSFGTNMPVSHADPGAALQALEALEFNVHCDLFETPASSYADFLLPVNTPWEREGLRIGFEIDKRAAAHVQLRQQMVPSLAETKSDNEIVFDLAVRLGFGDAFFNGSLEAGWDHMLKPIGLSVAQLRSNPQGLSASIDSAECKYARDSADGVNGFATETRRVELYSEKLLRYGYSPLPDFLEPAESPTDSRRTQNGRFPYVLSSAKNGYYCHSQHRGIASLRRRAQYPIAEISATLAAEKGIAPNDWVRISTRLGAARFVAKVEPSLSHEVVVAEYGWWQPCPELGQPGFEIVGQESSNFNKLISAEERDPISGSVALRSFLCNVELDALTEPRHRGWPAWKAFRVTAKGDAARAVASITLAAENGDELPDYLPGQHIALRVPSTDGSSSSPIRAYSLVGPANVRHRRQYSIAVRLETGGTEEGECWEGRVSSQLHRQVRVGDVLELTRPNGIFILPRSSPQPIVLLAAGVGITPFMSLLESLGGLEETPEVWLFHGSRDSDTHVFRERLSAIARASPNLRVLNFYSNPLPHDQVNVDFDFRGRITFDAISIALIERRARFYLCGPEVMVQELRRGLMERAVPEFDIFSEQFKSPSAGDRGNMAAAKVTFRRTKGLVGVWNPGVGTLLDLGDAMGVAMPAGCRVGQCESCRVSVIAGRVVDLNGHEFESSGTCLACQAVPIGDIVIDA